MWYYGQQKYIDVALKALFLTRKRIIVNFFLSDLDIVQELCVRLVGKVSC
jgi:hypothetical protein